MTSNDVLYRIKKMLPLKKIGHAGTLDPLATGLLVIMINEATKLSGYLMNEEKEYTAQIVIGIGTDTEDATGQVIAKKPVTEQIDVDLVLASLVGEIRQVPPMFSAIKVNGKKLYELARSGKTVEREARTVSVKQVRRLGEVEYADGCARFSFSAVVSKGTYIRTLCVEIGNRLGYPAHMSALNRTKSGRFRIEDAYTLADIESGAYQLLDMKEALQHFPMITVDAALSRKIQNGVALTTAEVGSMAPTVVFVSAGQVIAIYIYKEGFYRAERVWN